MNIPNFARATRRCALPRARGLVSTGMTGVTVGRLRRDPGETRWTGRRAGEEQV
ncbi:MAG: hypothetical protein U1F77_19370 [Kiritimatiellia bacterium]